jgi:hypothetical protein
MTGTMTGPGSAHALLCEVNATLVAQRRLAADIASRPRLVNDRQKDDPQARILVAKLLDLRFRYREAVERESAEIIADAENQLDSLRERVAAANAVVRADPMSVGAEVKSARHILAQQDAIANRIADATAKMILAREA